MKRLALDFIEAYADCYRWLYRVCPPWRWLLSLGLWPGSPMNRAVSVIRNGLPEPLSQRAGAR